VIVLGIETSCDETAAAVVSDGRHILSNIVSSQVDIHARYGGIVPEVASRQHILSIIPVIQQALERSGQSWNDIDGMAVTCGPGLAGSLLVGLNTAKAIAFARQLPLTGVNHLQAHIYANWLSSPIPCFPAVCLVVSGGHTDMVYMKGHGEYNLLGQTRDDAAGEAFDKAARILGLGYPGGPAIDRAAEEGEPHFDLPRAWSRGTYDFSFSGLKTALMRLQESSQIDNICDAAASFRLAVVDVLVKKTINAARKYNVANILLSGGVAANRLLRQRLAAFSPVPVIMPPPSLCTDNAAMVASCGFYQMNKGLCHDMNLDVCPSLGLTS